jgi:hypothetical protein
MKINGLDQASTQQSFALASWRFTRIGAVRLAGLGGVWNRRLV